ncbi:MAG: branched-chain amino acid ABC transporter permease [Candidatus Bathyarchaeia archaeon]
MNLPAASVILQSLIGGILMGGVYSLIAVGLTLIFGVMKIINFAHGSLMMLGMYVTYWAYVLFGIDPYISLILSAPSLFLLGVLIQRYLISFVMNAPAHNQLLLTLGVSLFLENLALLIWSPNFRSLEISYLKKNVFIGDAVINLPKAIAFIFAVLLTGLVYLFLLKSDLGKAIRAASEEKEGAMAVGIDLKRVLYTAFGIGTACAGAAGTLITPFFYVNPHVGSTFVITAFVVVVLGGMGNFMGAFIGGLLVGIAESLGAAFLPGQIKQFIIYIIFILVLLFKPEGLFGKRRYK